MKTNLIKSMTFVMLLGVLTFSCGKQDAIKKKVISVNKAAEAGQDFLTQKLDLSVDPIACQNGSNPCANISIKSTDGARYSAEEKAWALQPNGLPLSVSIDLDNAMPLALTFYVKVDDDDEGKPNSPVSIKVNDKTLVAQYADTDPNIHPVAWKIPLSMVNDGSNTVDIQLSESATATYFINAIKLASFDEPQRVIADEEALNTDLYVQFGLANISGGINVSGDPVDREIWTRAYSLMPPQPDPTNPEKWLPNEDLVPGPTYVFKPDDMLNVNFINNLNKQRSKWLADYEGSISSNPDDIQEHIDHEINIPHNADNTNLHTHGLHVDPIRDNVVLLIIPEDDSVSGYDTELQETIPNAPGNQVLGPDGPTGDGKYWTWQYSYKIPKDHLPGTHWFHAHKHGSTSTHVENGMAGTFVVRPIEDDNTFAPGLWNDDPDKSKERVMVMQEIANYGIQQGNAAGQDSVAVVPAGSPDITINGMHQPTLQLTKGQVERWRIVNAGANHRTSSFIWLGKKTDQFATDTVATATDTVVVSAPLYVDATDAQVYLVALDGVTINKPVRITAAKPLLLAAGNRADLLVKITDDSEYALFKNYPQPEGTDEIFPGGFTNEEEPAEMNKDSYDLLTDYTGFKKSWKATKTAAASNTSMVPLLTGVTDGKNNKLINIDLKNQVDSDFPGVGWQPSVHGGGAIDNQLLFFVNMVDGQVSNSTIPDNLADVDLSPFSPTGSAANLIHLDEQGVETRGKAPSYAAPIKDSDITIPPQVMVFDFASTQFHYLQGDTVNTKIKQFWLNGRQFSLEDFVGNPGAEALIQDPIEKTSTSHHGDTLGFYKYYNASSMPFSNEVTLNGEKKAYWTNPGYYTDIIPSEESESTYIYKYDIDAPPTYDDLTGGVDGSQPVSTTAQEWLLINNSDVFHPFHIHISPFFVTEIGQLHYEAGTGWQSKYIYNDPYGSAPERQSWELEVSNSAVSYVVGNWWDVIMIPPHGYVKLKTWINVPDQNVKTNAIQENSNKEGMWVFHCHILRHEDRGMMMVVKTKKK